MIIDECMTKSFYQELLRLKEHIQIAIDNFYAQMKKCLGFTLILQSLHSLAHFMSIAQFIELFCKLSLILIPWAPPSEDQIALPFFFHANAAISPEYRQGSNCESVYTYG